MPETYTGHITRGLQGDTAPRAGIPAPHIWKTHSEEERRQRWREMGERPLTFRERFGDDLVPMFRPAWAPFLH